MTNPRHPSLAPPQAYDVFKGRFGMRFTLEDFNLQARAKKGGSGPGGQMRCVVAAWGGRHAGAVAGRRWGLGGRGMRGACAGRRRRPARPPLAPQSTLEQVGVKAPNFGLANIKARPTHHGAPRGPNSLAARAAARAPLERDRLATPARACPRASARSARRMNKR
jgi:hypothetical protein